MDHHSQNQRRISVPVPVPVPVAAPQLVDPTGTLILRPIPPPQNPIACYPAPNPYRIPVIVHGRPRPVLVGPPPPLRPVRVVLNPAARFQMEEQMTRSLIQFMQSEGLVPSPEEEAKREAAVEQLKMIIMEWIKKVAWQRQFPTDVIASTTAAILPFGSYGLGVHGSDSDIDALCVGPCFATIEDDFFIVLRNMFQSRPEVSEIHCVKSAKVPLMRFKFNGISVDFPYAQLQVVSVPDNVDIIDPSVISDETSWRSLSGVRANTRIRQLVPHLVNFQSMLRCIKHWARRRGVYSHLLGFFGGIHLAILAAHVCQRHPNASISFLLSNFFETFSNWPWPEPVFLQGGFTPYKYPDGRSLMPIMMPCFPYDWCNSNITNSTFIKIKAELKRACHIIGGQALGGPNLDWSRLFNCFPYTQKYYHFVRILLVAPDVDELQDWVGWVKSRFRSLLLKMEVVQGFCDPNPTEYVDHNVSEPNTVFYWGLHSNGIDLIDIDSVREDFMKSVDKDLDGDVRSTRRHCRLELSIVASSELPKDVQLDSGGLKGSKACWRMEDSQMRIPIYSQHLPYYFVGYVAQNGDYQNA